MANKTNSTFKLHEHQTVLWNGLDNPQYRELSAQAGIQGGKTTFGSLAIRKKIDEGQKKYPGCNFLVTADNYKTLSQATIPTLRKAITAAIGEYKEQKQEIHLHKGGVIYIRTGTDPHSVEGIPDCYFAWMDEAGKCSRTFQINVLGRVARLQGQVLYTSTPYAMNWLFKEVEKPWKNGEREDILLVRWSSADNPSFPREEFERQKKLLDAKIFRRKYMGIHERMEGLIYELTQQNFIQQYYLPEGTQFFAGCDFGYVEGHEFGFSVRAVTPNGLHQPISTFKKAGLDPDAQVRLAKEKVSQFNIKKVLCDPARPDMIALFQKHGLPAIAFHQYGSDQHEENYKRVISGVQAHQSLINSGRYKILEKDHPDLMDEYETYHWDEDADGEKKKEQPVKENDHILDAERMITVGTLNLKFKAVRDPIVSTSRPEIDTFNPRKKTRKAATSWEAY